VKSSLAAKQPIYCTANHRSRVRFTRHSDGAQSAPHASALPFPASRISRDWRLEFNCFARNHHRPE